MQKPGLTRQSIYHYLAERDSGRLAWPYPEFMRDAQAVADHAAATLSEMDGDAWREFVREAEAQGVSPEKLLHHAVLYLVADLDAGRVTRGALDGADPARAEE